MSSDETRNCPLLLRPREQRQSIVMSMSVCPRAYLRSHKRDLRQFFVHVAYGRGSVLLWQGDKIPGEGAVLDVFLTLTMHCNAFAAKGIIPQWPGEGWWECTGWAKCDLRLPCCPGILSTPVWPHGQTSTMITVRCSLSEGAESHVQLHNLTRLIQINTNK